MAESTQCDNCGAVLTADDQFCGECGAPRRLPADLGQPAAAEAAEGSGTWPAPAPAEALEPPTPPRIDPAPQPAEGAPSGLPAFMLAHGPAPAPPRPGVWKRFRATAEGGETSSEAGWRVAVVVLLVLGVLACLGGVLGFLLLGSVGGENTTVQENWLIGACCSLLPIGGLGVLLVAVGATLWYTRLRER